MVKGGSDTTAKSEAMLTTKDHVVTLRHALRNEEGSDKDVLAGFQPFLKYNRNGLDVSLEMLTGSNMRAKKPLKKFCFNMCKEHLEEVYEECEYGWDDDEESEKLTDREARVVLVRNSEGEPVGFANFRFTLQGEPVDLMEGEPCLYVYDIHLDEGHQRKGLGKHIMQLLELVARKEKMMWLMIPVYDGHDEAAAFVTGALRGFEESQDFNDYDEMCIYSKKLAPQAARPTPQAPVKLPSPDSVLAGPEGVGRDMSGAEDLSAKLEAASLD